MSYAKRAAPVLALAAVLIFWEAAVRLFQIPLYVLPSPTEVLNALISDRLTLFSHSVITVAEALLGMGISLVLAVVLGILMDAFAPLRQVVYPILVVTQTVPMIVLAPHPDHLSGFGPGSEDSDCSAYVFFSHCGQFHRRHGSAGAGISSSGPLFRRQQVDCLPPGKNPGGLCPP